MSDNGLALAAQRCKSAFNELSEAEQARDEAQLAYNAADQHLDDARISAYDAQKILIDVAQGKIGLEDAGNGDVRLIMLPLDSHVATTPDHSYKDCPDLATCKPHGSQWVTGEENLMVTEEQRQRIAQVLLNAADSAGKPYINSLHVAERLADGVLIYAAHVLIDDSDDTEEEVR